MIDLTQCDIKRNPLTWPFLGLCSSSASNSVNTGEPFLQRKNIWKSRSIMDNLCSINHFMFDSYLRDDLREITRNTHIIIDAIIEHKGHPTIH